MRKIVKDDKHNNILHWTCEEFSKNFAAIKNLRKQYANFPFLYAYDDAEENTYLNAYLQAGNELDAFVCIEDNRVVGISIGCPFKTEMPICAGLDKFIAEHKKPYYFGDIIILKDAWGRGIADSLYKVHINHVKNKGYKSIVALLVERDESDPRRPAHYHPTTLWEKHGFVATAETTQFKWNTVSASGDRMRSEAHTLRVYEKIL